MSVAAADIDIAVESPLTDDMRGLIEALNATLLEVTPIEFCSHMSVEEMAGPETTVFVARQNGDAVACGALVRRGDGIGEVKRMYTRPSHRGRKIGAAILDHIVDCARAEGLERLVLETGHKQPAAYRVYENAGFSRCGPVLDYQPSKWLVFYEKPLIDRHHAA